MIWRNADVFNWFIAFKSKERNCFQISSFTYTEILECMWVTASFSFISKCSYYLASILPRIPGVCESSVSRCVWMCWVEGGGEGEGVEAAEGDGPQGAISRYVINSVLSSPLVNFSVCTCGCVNEASKSTLIIRYAAFINYPADGLHWKTVH